MVINVRKHFKMPIYLGDWLARLVDFSEMAMRVSQSFVLLAAGAVPVVLANANRKLKINNRNRTTLDPSVLEPLKPD